MRRAVHESFNPRAVERFQTVQREAAALAILRILRDPTTWEKNMETYVDFAIIAMNVG